MIRTGESKHSTAQLNKSVLTDTERAYGICRFMVRKTQAIKTHIFCGLQAFIRLEKMRSTKSISNWYQVQRNLFTLVIREYILNNLSDTCAV